MTRSTTKLTLGTILFALALASPATADTDAAAKLFRAGKTAFARHDYRAAAIDFEEAYREAPHPAVLFNAALAWEAANEPTRAADAFAGALATPGLDGEQTAQGRKKLDALEQQLGVVDATGPAGARVTLEHVREGRLPSAIHVTPGDHQLLFVSEGGARKQASVTIAAGERRAVRFEPDAPVVAAPKPPAERPPPATSSALPTFGWVALGAGAVAFGVGVALGVKAMDARSTYEASGRRDLDAYDRAISLRGVTTGLWIGAAAAGALGVTLLIAAPRRAPVAVVLGPTSVAATARF